MLEDLRNFKIANPEAQKQMEDMLARVETVRDRNLGPAEQGLTRATKSLENRPEPRPTASLNTPARATDQAAGQEPEATVDVSGPSVRTRPSNPRSRPSRESEGRQPRADPQCQDSGADRRSKEPRADPQSKIRPGLKRSPEVGFDRAARSQRRQLGSPRARPARGSRPEDPESDPARAALAEAKTNQKAIADQLQKMLDSLSEFETYRGVVKDAQELLKQHEQAMKQTAEAASRPEMVGKPVEELTPEQKSDLANLASRQSRGALGLAEAPGADGRDGQTARRVRPPGVLGDARGRGEEPEAGDRRQAR